MAKAQTDIGIAGPAALIVTVIYILIGQNAAAAEGLPPVEWFKLIPYLLVIILAISGINVTVV